MMRRLVHDDERGELTLQLSVIFPALVLFVYLSVQVGLWWHAGQIADAAVAEAVETAQVEGATDIDGADAAVWFLSQSGYMENVTIQVGRTADTVTATVTGDAYQIIPIGNWPVSAAASGPLEQTVSQADR